MDRHVFMRYNSYKNLSELYERTCEFQKAKDAYTQVSIQYNQRQALKIKAQDALIWTRLGFLEYREFNNLGLAKKCLELAIESYTTIQRRSAGICPILVKLAEIAFLEFDYIKSEQMADAILQRTGEKGGESEVFACLLKSFFLSLRGEEEKAKALL